MNEPNKIIPVTDTQALAGVAKVAVEKGGNTFLVQGDINFIVNSGNGTSTNWEPNPPQVETVECRSYPVLTSDEIKRRNREAQNEANFIPTMMFALLIATLLVILGMVAIGSSR